MTRKRLTKATVTQYQHMLPVGQEVDVHITWRHAYDPMPRTWQRRGVVTAVRQARQSEDVFDMTLTGVLVVEVAYTPQRTYTPYPNDDLVYLDGKVPLVLYLDPYVGELSLLNDMALTAHGIAYRTDTVDVTICRCDVEPLKGEG
jgi:hypothetical protein